MVTKKVEPADLALTSLPEGTRRQHCYVITDSMWRAMTDVFGDLNPIHVDEAQALAAGFPGRVMHGAILAGLASHFVGMILPGRRSLLLSLDLRFARPSHLGDEISLAGQVVQRVDSESVVVILMSFENMTRNYLAARGKAQVRVSGG